MSANERIQWLHNRISEGTYPNAFRLAEKFGISHRQAQRDVDFLRGKLGAPMVYSSKNRGFAYAAPFSLPVYITSGNDDEYYGLSGMLGTEKADSTVVQMQIPYTAEIEISDKLGVIELKNFITAQKSKNRYTCEFHSVELFLGKLISVTADVRIVSPDWLRERVVASAERMLKNNK